jgi:simple sugar transport system permease protein
MSEIIEEVDLRADRVVQRSPIIRWARKWALQLGIVAVCLVIWVAFLIGSPRTFLAPQIYKAFMQTTPFFAIIALTATLVVIAKEIDLSFPSIMAWGMANFTITYGVTQNYFLALIALLLAGLYAGFLNGLIVVNVVVGLIALVGGCLVFGLVFLFTNNLLIAFIGLLITGVLAYFLNRRIESHIGIPSLVATIGTQFLWRGVVLIVTNGKGVPLTVAQGTWIHGLTVGRFGDIPAQMFWMIIIAVLVWIFLNRTQAGAHVYLIGDNIDSARLMGINADGRKIMVFCLVGVSAAFAGLLSSMEVTYFWPNMGDGTLLMTLSSVFLGGTSVFGGTGTIFGTFVASFIIGAINAGIVAAGLTGFWTQFIYGLIIVISVSIQTILSTKLR